MEVSAHYGLRLLIQTERKRMLGFFHALHEGIEAPGIVLATASLGAAAITIVYRLYGER
jgi:hypothetical protein